MARGSRGTVSNDEGGVAAGRQSKEPRDQISVHTQEAERVNPKVERDCTLSKPSSMGLLGLEKGWSPE